MVIFAHPFTADFTEAMLARRASGGMLDVCPDAGFQIFGLEHNLVDTGMLSEGSYQKWP
jgi:hypothetical protein